ncbi:HU family DNA-binding protein [bacterium]|nr:HU family DNA-binding protein [bacterium]
MNREQLSVVLSQRCDLTKTKAREILDSLTEIVAEELVQGKDVLLVGFGRFTVRERAARKGRNPKTGATIALPTTKSVGFVPSKGLRFALQRKRSR